ncbi:hypothetical protein K4Q07_08690 [Staphylococcus epidermidis]|nr:hypothetical protein [Staphylococcus epidermidis]
MSNIYIILYTHLNSFEGDSAWLEEFYFTDKNKAIKHLKDNGFGHEHDDIYVKLWTSAEIILLNKQEER